LNRRTPYGRLGFAEVLYSITIIIALVTIVPTTVQVAEKTLQLLNKLKEEMRARSHDEVIRTLISERKRIPRSMFGTNPKLKPFSKEDEADFHEL